MALAIRFVRHAYDRIHDLGGHYPASLVLNYQDYEFQPYAIGADIVMQDTSSLGSSRSDSRSLAAMGL